MTSNLIDKLGQPSGMVVITMDTSNDIFQTGSMREELGRIIHLAAELIRSGDVAPRESRNLRDLNGNTIGAITFDCEED